MACSSAGAELLVESKHCFPGHSVLQLLEGRVHSASPHRSLESGRYMCSSTGVDGHCQTEELSALQVSEHPG